MAVSPSRAGEAVNKSLNKRKYLAQRRKAAEAEKKTRQLFIPNLCAPASLRETIHFFTDSDARATSGIVACDQGIAAVE